MLAGNIIDSQCPCESELGVSLAWIHATCCFSIMYPKAVALQMLHSFRTVLQPTEALNLAFSLPWLGICIIRQHGLALAFSGWAVATTGMCFKTAP